MKLDPYQLFSIFTCINCGLVKFFYESLYLYWKRVALLLSSCRVWSPIKQNGHVPIYMLIGKNIGTGMIVLVPLVNTLRFQVEKFLPSVSTLTGPHEITRTKLIVKHSKSGLCAHIILKTCVLQGDMVRGCNWTMGSLYWGKNKISISSPARWFWIFWTHKFWQIHTSVQIPSVFDSKWSKNYLITVKTYSTGKNTPVFGNY